MEPVVSARAMAVQDVGDDPGSMRVAGRTSDLVSVHKQFGVCPSVKVPGARNFRLCKVLVLLFGATNVAASLRVARDIVRIARQGLRALITSPSNDFAELAVEPGAESTNFAVGGLFKLLVARFEKMDLKLQMSLLSFHVLEYALQLLERCGLQSKCQANGIPDSARSWNSRLVQSPTWQLQGLGFRV